MKIEENLRVWQRDYDWSTAGDEWSTVWGSSEAQWYWCIFPRIHKFVPCGTILEIAPGFGRWTQYLRHFCQRLEIVDLTQKCIDHCRVRFADDPNIGFHVNDGLTLNMIRDGSIDFAFSFDSLVHVEADVIDSYVEGLSRKLTKNGVGFLHHSNFAACERHDNVTTTHLRASSVSAAIFRDLCFRHDMSCVAQEIVDWGYPSLDCLSVITPNGSKWSRSTVILENNNFLNAAAITKASAALY